MRQRYWHDRCEDMLASQHIKRTIRIYIGKFNAQQALAVLEPAVLNFGVCPPMRNVGTHHKVLPEVMLS